MLADGVRFSLTANSELINNADISPTKGVGENVSKSTLILTGEKDGLSHI